MIHQISAHLAFAKRNLRFVILALIALGLTTMNSGIVIAEEDLTPPVLTAVSVDISQVNTSLSAQTVLVTKSATDDLSGVAYSGTVGCTGFTSGLVFTSQSGANKVNVNNCAFVLVSGTDTSGDFSATATFPRFAETGFWQLTLVIMEDQTGNTDFVSLPELLALGIDVKVEVTSAGDATPPVLTGVSVDRLTVDTSLTSQAVQVTKSGTDDLSGVAYSGTPGCTGFTAGLVFTSPSGANSVDVNNCAFTLTAGTDLNGDFSATATFPQFAEVGVWQLTLVRMQDQAGNIDNINSIELAALGINTSVEVISPGDGTPPVLTGVSVVPQQVETSQSSQVVQVTKSATDDLSGVAYLGTSGCTNFTSGLVFTSPSGTNQVTISNCAFSLAAGSDNNGDFSAPATFPQFAEIGLWQLTLVVMEDQAGNTDFISLPELQALGIDVAVEVIATSDSTPPVLTGVSVDPQQIDTSQSAQTVVVTRSVTDDLSGVAHSGAVCSDFGGAIFFLSPSGASSVQANNCAFALVSGTDLNGDFAASVTLPQFAEEGIWRLNRAIVADQAGNLRFYFAADLQALGFDVGIEVIALADVTPPVLTAFSFTPSVVDVSGGSAAVTVTFEIEDALSGLEFGAAAFVSPSGQQAQLQATAVSATLVSGTLNDGTYEDILTVPIFSESGIWVVERVFLRDEVGNTVTIPTTELAQAGFPTELTVERNTQPTADAGGPYTVNEGGSVVVTGSGSDPDSDPITFAWDLDNDGTFETPGQSVTLSAAALNGPSSLTITVQVTDTSGLSATDAATVDVLNVAPTVVANDAIVSANEGATANNSGTFSDPGADTVTIAASAGTISQGAGTWN
ncbi:MAG: PKD domain-containing protein, partial [Chloroflexi bacterium]|nr:PKD domain-containing protein [Chloroflexota bacterium]